MLFQKHRRQGAPFPEWKFLPLWRCPAVSICCNGGDDSRHDGGTGGRAVDIAAADDVDMNVVVVYILARQFAHDGSGVEYGVFGHGAGRLIEA